MVGRDQLYFVIARENASLRYPLCIPCMQKEKSINSNYFFTFELRSFAYNYLIKNIGRFFDPCANCRGNKCILWEKVIDKFECDDPIVRYGMCTWSSIPAMAGILTKEKRQYFFRQEKYANEYFFSNHVDIDAVYHPVALDIKFRRKANRMILKRRQKKYARTCNKQAKTK